jgi:PBP1b-binding outer membrane lipoprotein LpoB
MSKLLALALLLAGCAAHTAAPRVVPIAARAQPAAHATAVRTDPPTVTAMPLAEFVQTGYPDPCAPQAPINDAPRRGTPLTLMDRPCKRVVSPYRDRIQFPAF